MINEVSRARKLVLFVLYCFIVLGACNFLIISELSHFFEPDYTFSEPDYTSNEPDYTFSEPDYTSNEPDYTLISRVIRQTNQNIR